MPKSFQLLPGAESVKLPGGRVVKADRRGRIRVDDETAAAIRGSSAMKRYDAVIEMSEVRGFSKPDDPMCPGCNFTPWPWQKTCPRCGAQLGDPT